MYITSSRCQCASCFGHFTIIQFHKILLSALQYCDVTFTINANLITNISFADLYCMYFRCNGYCEHKCFVEELQVTFLMADIKLGKYGYCYMFLHILSEAKFLQHKIPAYCKSTGN